MGSFIQESAKAAIRGDVEVEGGKFTGVRRSDVTIEVGDVFTVPAGFKVYKQAIGKDSSAEYIWVNMVGSDDVKKFFPGMMDRKVRVCDENGTPTGASVLSSGNPCDDYRKNDKVQDCVQNLVDRKIRVSKVDYVRTLDYVTGKTRNAPVYTFEYA